MLHEVWEEKNVPSLILVTPRSNPMRFAFHIDRTIKEIAPAVALGASLRDVVCPEMPRKDSVAG